MEKKKRSSQDTANLIESSAIRYWKVDDEWLTTEEVLASIMQPAIEEESKKVWPQGEEYKWKITSSEDDGFHPHVTIARGETLISSPNRAKMYEEAEKINLGYTAYPNANSMRTPQSLSVSANISLAEYLKNGGVQGGDFRRSGSVDSPIDIQKFVDSHLGKHECGEFECFWELDNSVICPVCGRGSNSSDGYWSALSRLYREIQKLDFTIEFEFHCYNNHHWLVIDNKTKKEVMTISCDNERKDIYHALDILYGFRKGVEFQGELAE